MNIAISKDSLFLAQKRFGNELLNYQRAVTNVGETFLVLERDVYEITLMTRKVIYTLFHLRKCEIFYTKEEHKLYFPER